MTYPISDFEVRPLDATFQKLLDEGQVVYLVAVTRTEGPVIYASDQPQEVTFPLLDVARFEYLKTAVMYRYVQNPNCCSLNNKCWPC
jgi:hypothetical protein